MVVKAVFFDMGGTIETYRQTRDFRIGNVHFLRECLLNAGLIISKNDEQLTDLISQGISEYHRLNLQSMVELPPGKIWSEIVFKDFPEHKKDIESIGENLSLIYETRFYIREMRPEMPGVLEKIKHLGLRIGCISNTHSLTQVPYSLKEYGILDYFNPVILSSIYTRRKPDPSIFYHAARMAGVPTSACVYVGDKINRDILGAKLANYALAVQIRHQFDDGEKDGGAIPDNVIDDMNDLLPLLEENLKNRQLPAYNNGKVIKAVFFDAGDVLYYRPKDKLLFPEFLKNREVKPVPGFEKKMKEIKDLAYQGKIRRHDYFERLVRLYGIDDPQDIQEGVQDLDRDENEVGIFEGVPATINELKKKGYLLAIITDTAMPFSRKLSWFEEYGFGRAWDVVISSRELGVRKPSPIMYNEALAQSGVSPQEAIFVGHKKSELDGAKSVGLRTVAFNYDTNAKADYYIKSFPDLLKIPILDQ